MLVPNQSVKKQLLNMPLQKDDASYSCPAFLNGKLIAVAAIWKSIDNKDKTALPQSCLLTTKASTALSAIHER